MCSDEKDKIEKRVLEFQHISIPFLMRKLQVTNFEAKRLFQMWAHEKSKRDAEFST